MTENTEDIPPQETDEAAADAERAKKLERFEKFFRLMDNAYKEEALSAFSHAYDMLPEIGLKFSGILDMLDSAGGGENTEALVQEYQTANEQLKAAEGILLRENDRLNMLLRAFRDAKLPAEKFNPDEIKGFLNEMAVKLQSVNETASTLSMPEDAAQLQEVYTMRVAEALRADTKPAHNAVQKFGMWLFRLNRDEITRSKEIIAAQEKVIKEQADLIHGLSSVKSLGEEIAKRLEALTGQSAPAQVYDNAVKDLRDAQLELGDEREKNAELAAENGELRAGIEALQNENDQLADKLSQAETEHGELVAEIRRLKSALKDATKTGGIFKGRKKKAQVQTQAATDDSDDPLSGDSQPDEDGASFMEEKCKQLQDELDHVYERLGVQLLNAPHAPYNQLSTEKEFDEYDTTLHHALNKLAGATRVIDKLPKGRLRSFFSRRKRKQAQQELREQVTNIRKTVRTVHEAAQFLALAKDFNTAAVPQKEQMLAEIAAFWDKQRALVDAYVAKKMASVGL